MTSNHNTAEYSKTQAGILHRLKTAQGHLSAVIEMVENQASCEEVVRQLFAIRAALDATGRQIILGDIQACVQNMQEGESIEGVAVSIQRIISLAQKYP